MPSTWRKRWSGLFLHTRSRAASTGAARDKGIWFHPWAVLRSLRKKSTKVESLEEFARLPEEVC
jgi:hypothetical protein